MQRPVAAGVAGGVGTTMLSAALAIHDAGVYWGGSVEVLVCRSTVHHLGWAHRVLATTSVRPVLAVVADGPWRTPPGVAARLRMIGPGTSGVVRVPFVLRWRDLDAPVPWQQAAAVLRYPERVPRSLRPFSSAMAELARAVYRPSDGPVEPLTNRPPTAVEPVSDRPS